MTHAVLGHIYITADSYRGRLLVCGIAPATPGIDTFLPADGIDIGTVNVDDSVVDITTSQVVLVSVLATTPPIPKYAKLPAGTQIWWKPVISGTAFGLTPSFISGPFAVVSAGLVEPSPYAEWAYAPVYGPADPANANVYLLVSDDTGRIYALYVDGTNYILTNNVGQEVSYP